MSSVEVILLDLDLESEYFSIDPGGLAVHQLFMALNSLYELRGKYEGYYEAISDYSRGREVREGDGTKRSLRDLNTTIGMYYAELSNRLEAEGREV
jgi:hypothetical protein